MRYSDGVEQLLHAVQRLQLHLSYVVMTIVVGAVISALMIWAEIWGSARAKRRTERAIADAQRAHARELRT